MHAGEALAPIKNGAKHLLDATTTRARDVVKNFLTSYFNAKDAIDVPASNAKELFIKHLLGDSGMHRHESLFSSLRNASIPYPLLLY